VETIARANIHDILKHIPHRYPFLLIDGLEGCEPNKWVRVVKNVSFADWFITGRDPSTAVMPQMLVVEALAQAAGVLCHFSGMMSQIGKSIIFFAGIENCQFTGEVKPGNRLTLDCHLRRSLRGVAKLSASASADGRLVVTSDLTAVVRDVGKVS